MKEYIDKRLDEVLTLLKEIEEVDEQSNDQKGYMSYAYALGTCRGKAIGARIIMESVLKLMKEEQ